MNHLTKITIIIIAVSALYIGYQNLVVIPREKIDADKKEVQAKLDRELTAKMEREYKYNSCMSDAHSRYVDDWNSRCEILDREPNCSLPQSLADDHDNDLEADRDRCVTMYK